MRHEASAHVIPRDAIRVGDSRTARFDGERFGSSISFFFVDNDPGEGPGLHRHPYDETWILIEGTAEFIIGDERVRAGRGDSAVVQAGVWHAFVNAGRGVLSMICVHASPIMIQEFAPIHDAGRGGDATVPVRNVNPRI